MEKPVKTTEEILAYLSDCGNTAVLTAQIGRSSFRDTFEAMCRHETSWKELEGAYPHDNMSGVRRVVVVVERFKGDPSLDGPTITTIQRS